MKGPNFDNDTGNYGIQGILHRAIFLRPRVLTSVHGQMILEVYGFMVELVISVNMMIYGNMISKPTYGPG